jgi:hypothetical protein
VGATGELKGALVVSMGGPANPRGTAGPLEGKAGELEGGTKKLGGAITKPVGAT